MDQSTAFRFQTHRASSTTRITMTTRQKDLHKAGGRAIPGYIEMLGDTPEEE